MKMKKVIYKFCINILYSMVKADGEVYLAD